MIIKIKSNGTWSDIINFVYPQTSNSLSFLIDIFCFGCIKDGWNWVDFKYTFVVVFEIQIGGEIFISSVEFSPFVETLIYEFGVTLTTRCLLDVLCLESLFPMILLKKE